ncbi:MAG: UvrD-helicase domain-containing protein, partial [Cyanobium sp.]
MAELDAWIAEQPADGCYEAVRAQDLLSTYFHPAPFAKLARRNDVDQRAGERLPQESLLRAIADLVDGPAEAVLLHACHWGRAELARRRERRGVISFSGLLEQLDPGLDEAIPSPLLEAVGRRYRAVLVDEFQDTDPIQWRILRRAFGPGGQTLVLVGDPKQAIYRFRGGDLDTYRSARGDAAELYALADNRRSTPELVAACNALMAPGLQRSQLAVPPVNARSSRRGPEGLPIELLWLGPDDPGDEAQPSRSDLEARLPAWIAATLERLLAEGIRLDDGRAERPLEASDCCLLVNNHRQAEALRQALERRGLASRLVSRADVFATPGATALQRLVDALADPADLNRLRLLAASPLQGWSAARIAATDAAGWSQLA